jgi:23S rRNA pseudouridine1911/1915/1917 synthase
VIGDSVYGMRLTRFHEKMCSPVVDAISGLQGHMLHAELLEFEHPDSGKLVRFEAPLPPEFAGFLHLLREQA